MADCPFCSIARGDGPAEVVHQDEHVVAFLDRAPLIHGHVLVATREHVADLDTLPAGLVGPLFSAVQLISRAMPGALAADGTFTAINTRISQSVPHMHVHVVPRRKGDGLFRAGLVWKRTPYPEGKAEEVAGLLRAAIAREASRAAPGGLAPR